MPSFFEGLKRLVGGQPVFDPNDQPTEPISAQSSGQKITPEVVIERIDCREKGSTDMECDAIIKNRSSVDIEVTKLSFLGDFKDIGAFLKPGEQREVRIYYGPQPQNTYEDKCELQYKDPTGDYFSTIHNLEFIEQPDGGHLVRRIRYAGYVRDI